MGSAGDKRAAAAPVTSAERIGELDILRGFALLGVLIASLVWFSFGILSTDPQREAFLAEDANRFAAMAVNWLVSDKANTLFAVLFGIGFWVQQERLKARGADFERLYLRRLTILLIFGFANLILIWPWDILQTYAMVGFILFALRRLSTRTMLVLGIGLMLIARPLTEYVFTALGIAGPAREIVFSDAAAQARQAAALEGSYWQWIIEAFRLNWYDFFISGSVLAWVLYVLGRFLVGAWIARRGFLQRLDQITPVLRRIVFIALPLGLVLEAVNTAKEFDAIQPPVIIGGAVHAIGAPLLALGYATGVLLLARSSWSGKWLYGFASVGRTALTNYVLLGMYIGFLLYGFGPGLGLAGRLGPAAALALAIAFFGLQMIVSSWWLGRFRFGPLEWAWRALTYGERPAFRRAAAA